MRGNLVKANAVCEKFNISKRTLCRWKNEGLPSITLSYNIVRYDLEAVMEWVKSKKVLSTGADK